jgi:hypothetical protein
LIYSKRKEEINLLYIYIYVFYYISNLPTKHHHN